MQQEDKKHFALNRTLLFIAFAAGFIGWISGVMLAEGETGAGIVGLIIAIVMLLGMIILPYGYRFDRKGITICYVFLPSERYLWSKIRAIQVGYGRRGPGYFQLVGKSEGKERFYTEGQVCKNRRTKRLLESYWDGTITGYFFEDIRKWWRRRKDQQEKNMRRHRADEVVLMERTAREETRSALALWDARAAQMGISMKIKFCYTGEDEEESNSRPEGNYTYTAQVYLYPRGEQKANKCITVYSDLLHVRLGKTDYRGVKDEEALTDLQEGLTELLDELQNGTADPEIWEQLE